MEQTETALHDHELEREKDDNVRHIRLSFYSIYDYGCENFMFCFRCISDDNCHSSALFFKPDIAVISHNKAMIIMVIIMITISKTVLTKGVIKMIKH